MTGMLHILFFATLQQYGGVPPPTVGPFMAIRYIRGDFGGRRCRDERVVQRPLY